MSSGSTDLCSEGSETWPCIQQGLGKGGMEHLTFPGGAQTQFSNTQGWAGHLGHAKIALLKEDPYLATCLA